MARPLVPPLRKLKRAHADLMAAYTRALRRSAEIPTVSVRAGLGFLVRFWVESHLRAQLARAAYGYLILEQTVGPDDPRLPWLKAAREQLERSVTALGSSRRILTALSPAAIIPVVGLLKGVDFDDAANAVGLGGVVESDAMAVVPPIAGALSLYALLYFALFMLSAFIAKRRILYPRASHEEGFNLRRRPPPPDATNVYRAEDRLFDLLPVRKRLEPRPDLLIFGFLYGGILAAVATWMIWDDGFSLSLGDGFAILYLVLGLALIVVTATRWRRRRWR